MSPRRRDGLRLPARPWLELRLQPVEHLGMGAGIDLALQDALRTGHRQRRHLLAKLLLRRLDLLCDLRLGAGDEPLAFGLGLRFRLLDALAGGALRLRDELM